MFIEEEMLIKATHDDGKTFTGTVYKIVVQPCEDDNNRPHALIFISQDKRFIKQEGEFGCVSEWVDKLKSIEVLEKSKDTFERDDYSDNDMYFGEKSVTQRIIAERDEQKRSYGFILGESG